MALKSGHTSRPPGGSTKAPASRRNAFKRPAAKKPAAKKAAATTAHGHATRRTGAAGSYAHGYAHPIAVTSTVVKRRAKLILVADKGGSRTFERFGELPSTERETAIRAGLPATFLDEAIAKVGVTRGDLLAGLGIASSTAARVKQQGKRFSLEDSERLARLARLWHDAFIVYETDEGTRGWLTNPVPSAGGIPVAMLATNEGFERAHRSIMQLAYGVFA
jgi:putative toxin-antitoxin system antitoxin component (TIGR02293 family)